MAQQPAGGVGSNQYASKGASLVAADRSTGQHSAVAAAVTQDDLLDIAEAFGADVPEWVVGSPLNSDDLAETYGERFRCARLVRLQGHEYDGGNEYTFESWLLVAGDVPDDAAIQAAATQTIVDCYRVEGEDGVAEAVEEGMQRALDTVPTKYWRANGLIPAVNRTGPFTDSAIEPQHLFIEWEELESGSDAAGEAS